MTIQVNAKLSAFVSADMAYWRFGGASAGAGSITFCIGAMPSDAQVDTITALSSTLITSASCGVMNTAGSVIVPVSPTATPVVWNWSSLPTVKSVTSTKAGVIGWAAVQMNGAANIVIVDVGLVNSGAVIQLDTTTVSVSTVFTLVSLSFKDWRA